MNDVVVKVEECTAAKGFACCCGNETSWHIVNGKIKCLGCGNIYLFTDFICLQEVQAESYSTGYRNGLEAGKGDVCNKLNIAKV